MQEVLGDKFIAESQILLTGTRENGSAWLFFSTVAFGCFYHMVTILKKYTLFQILVSLKTFAAGYLSPAILMQHQLPEKVETGAKVIDVTQVCFYHRT